MSRVFIFSLSLLLLAACTQLPPASTTASKQPAHTSTPKPASVTSRASPLSPPAPPSAAVADGVAANPALSYRRPPVVRARADGAQIPAVRGLLADADRAQQRGDLEVATANLERAQRLAPQSALVYQRLAELRLQQKRPAEAEQMARKALAYATTNTQQATLWRQIAEARRQQGNLSSAQEALSRAGELDAAAASAAAENVP